MLFIHKHLSPHAPISLGMCWMLEGFLFLFSLARAGIDTEDVVHLFGLCFGSCGPLWNLICFSYSVELEETTITAAQELLQKLDRRIYICFCFHFHTFSALKTLNILNTSNVNFTSACHKVRICCFFFMLLYNSINYFQQQFHLLVHMV